MTLNVGNPTKAFRIHRNLLCDASPVFRAAFLGNFQESERQVMDLDEDDTLAFEVITQWLYTQTCALSEDASPDDAVFVYRLSTFKHWPRKLPTAESFADAGFVHKPDDDSKTSDNVICDQCHLVGLLELYLPLSQNLWSIIPATCLVTLYLPESGSANPESTTGTPQLEAWGQSNHRALSPLAWLRDSATSTRGPEASSMPSGRS